MFDQVRAAVATLKVVVRDFEPRVVDGHDARTLVELFAKVERLGAAGKALAARRVSETGTFRQSGHKTAGQYLAEVSGTTVGAAEAAIRSAERLDELPVANESFRNGELSEVQAKEISYAASKDPSAERRLVGYARNRRSVKGLRDECARVVAASVRDDRAWAQELHETRAMTRWYERGQYRADLRLAPDRAVRFDAAVEAETDRLFRQARAEGRQEPRAAYRADAIANLVERGPAKPIDARIDVSNRALERGHVVAGERCEIPGLGPIPVTAAKLILRDARVSVLVREEDKITHVSSPTRTIPAKLRRWLEATYRVCGRQDCDNPAAIIDHIHPYVEGGILDERNAWRLCKRCDDLKTYRGWKVVGSPGNWDLVPPDHPDAPAELVADGPDPP